ncbi:MAG: sodium/proline symporter [Planctomycetaceae bacterium]|nr:sodium/proline symporter [Planctomycetaceae bacterium]
MEAYRSQIILGSVALYMLMCIGVGLWAMRRTKDAHDFFMAGRSLGIFVTSVAVFSSTMSGFGFVGGPGLVYQMGMSSIWMVVCTAIGFALSFHLIATRIRLFAELRDSISLPDAVGSRYRSRSVSFWAAVAILLGVIGYLAAQIRAMATVLKNLLDDILGGYVSETGVPLEVCVAVSCAVLVFYCVTGGIIAGVYTDVVQGVMMVVAAILVCWAAMSAVDGGFRGMSETLVQDDPATISPWGTMGILGSLSWYFVFALGGAGQPHVVTKMMMTKKVSDIRLMLPLSIIGYSFTALLWISIGLAMRALVLQGHHPDLVHADSAAPQFLQSYTNPLLAGLVFAGLLAAIMSTADSFLNIGAAAVVHDIPRAVRGESLGNELFWARTATVLIAVFASLFSLYAGERMVALLGAFGWGTFAAALVPTVAIGFNWKRATPLAANVAIITSLVVNFGVKFFQVQLPWGFDVGALSLLLSLVLFVSISLLSRTPKLDDDIEAVMEL